MRDRTVSQGIVLGGAVQIILRLIADYTPYGQYLSLSGLGDYQVSNFATPQWLPNGLKSANPAIPAGWGGPSGALALNSSGAAPVPSGVGSYANWD